MLNNFFFTNGRSQILSQANMYSLSFDGVDDSCSLGANYNFERTDSWSWSFWVKYTGSAGSVIGNINSSGNFNGTGITILGTGQVNVQIVHIDTTNACDITTMSGLSSNTWNQVVVTYDGSSSANGINVYINGAIQTNSINHNNLSASSLGSIMNFGRLNYTGSFYQGLLDEIAVWSGTVLSAANVTSLYNGGTPTNISAFSVAASSWWRMGDSPDSISTGGIHDRIGSIDATPVNMVSGNIVADVP